MERLLVEEPSGILSFGGSRMALLDVESGFWGLRHQLEALIGERLTSSVLQQAGANGGASFAQSFADQTGTEGASLFTACLAAYQAAGFGQFEITNLDWPIGNIRIQANNSFESWMYRQHNNKPHAPICAYSAGVFVGFVNILGHRQDVVCIEHSCQAKGDAACVFELMPSAAAEGQQVVSFNPEPGLGRQLNLLEILFERMPVGIAVLDRAYYIQRYNATWNDFSNKYAPPSGKPLAPGICYFDHLPNTEATIKPLFDRALAGETVWENNVRLASDGIVTYWDVVLAPVIEDDDVVGMLTVSLDVTERVKLRQDLEDRVVARTQELQMLLEVAATANSSLKLDEMLTRTLDLLVDLVQASRAGVGLIDEATGQWQATILRPEQNVDPTELEKVLQAGQSVVQSGETRYIAPNPAAGFLEPGALLPLKIQKRKLGVLVIIGARGSNFTAEQLELFKSIAGQLSIAIEHAYLIEKTEDMAIAAERNRLARELHDAVTQTLFSASLIADVLPRIWERDMDQGRARLEELRELTRGALAEMRTLLLELRPATLTETSLAELLRQLVQAFGGRARLPIELIIEEERPFRPGSAQALPPEIQVALYRIVQEALNNITKHAGASQATLTLRFEAQAVVLSIQDNGRGFAVADKPTHSLGLSIMRERAQKIGADLTIESQIGTGTTITVHCPVANGAERKNA
ncbi:MAG: GAF domain-containing protein [Ardenticatenaceae bacterium]|nr:GAF domain-containing protein [Ardenticatenaceae bacterium]